MHLDPFYIQVLPQLTKTGSNECVKGVLPVTSIDIGFRHFDAALGIAYDINLSNTSEAILLSGVATANLITNCDRCLENTELYISGEIQGYYLFKPVETPGDEKLEVYELVDARGRIDISPPVLAAIVYELSPVTLCRPDCEGIGNQNSPGIGDFDSSNRALEVDEINTGSPFAILKDYPFEK